LRFAGRRTGSIGGMCRSWKYLGATRPRHREPRAATQLFVLPPRSSLPTTPMLPTSPTKAKTRTTKCPMNAYPSNLPHERQTANLGTNAGLGRLSEMMQARSTPAGKSAFRSNIFCNNSSRRRERHALQFHFERQDRGPGTAAPRRRKRQRWKRQSWKRQSWKRQSWKRQRVVRQSQRRDGRFLSSVSTCATSRSRPRF
jgi:hypothetical protein